MTKARKGTNNKSQSYPKSKKKRLKRFWTIRKISHFWRSNMSLNSWSCKNRCVRRQCGKSSIRGQTCSWLSILSCPSTIICGSISPIRCFSCPGVSFLCKFCWRVRSIKKICYIRWTRKRGCEINQSRSFTSKINSGVAKGSPQQIIRFYQTPMVKLIVVIAFLNIIQCLLQKAKK